MKPAFLSFFLLVQLIHAIDHVAAVQVLSDISLENVVTGLNTPVFVTNAGDLSHRLFIVEQGGRIKVLRTGSSSPTVFLDITGSVLSGGERGLLGLAFHPQFAA